MNNEAGTEKQQKLHTTGLVQNDTGMEVCMYVILLYIPIGLSCHFSVNLVYGDSCIQKYQNL